MKCYIIRKFTAIMLICLLATIPLTTVNAKESSDFSSNNLILNQRIKLLMKIGHFPTLSAGTVKDDTLTWSNGYGFYTKLPKIRASNDTIYMAGSVSKTITAAALMQLYDNGSFDLDDDVNDYLNFSLRNPKYPDVNITFRMLLAHQSSLRDYNYTDYYIFQVVKQTIDCVITKTILFKMKRQFHLF